MTMLDATAPCEAETMTERPIPLDSPVSGISAKTGIVDGDRAPFCYGMTEDKTFYSFDGQAGRAAVVILVGALPGAVTAPLIAEFTRHLSAFLALEADVLVLIDGQSAHVLDHHAGREERDGVASGGLRVVFCLAEYFRRCGFRDVRPALFVMDRAGRVVASLDDTAPVAPETVIEATLLCLSTLPREAPRDIALPAPLLLLPHLFDFALCDRLMAHFEASDHVPGGMASIGVDGRPFHKVDLTKKSRQDCILVPDTELYTEVLDLLSHRCLPELKKAFQFDALHTDRILIARYDETGGYFRRHRDNTASSVAFRQFALSVNLNTGDYDGGHLTFPEYNGHLYRPGRGAGIVFSASLLHEAMPVTRGSRYVLLTFFHNAEAQARRIAAGL